MATYTFPDGTTVGCFDGRQSTSPAFCTPVCAGLELLPEGEMLNQRGTELWQKLGMLAQLRAIGSCNFQTHGGSLHCADALSYYTEQASKRMPVAPLAIDARDATLENHTASFSGLMRRWDSWVTAVSAQESDVPKDSPGRFRLERQSRMEIWHESAGLIVGGGHNMMGAAVPYANVHLVTGADGETEFGEVKSSAGKPRELYMPRTVQASHRGDACCLTLNFAHGSVVWTLQPHQDNERFIITAQWDLAGVMRLCLQLPLVVWRSAEAVVNAKQLDAQPSILSDTLGKLEIHNATSRTSVTLKVPSVGVSRARNGLSPMRTYGRLFEKEHFDSPYHILLTSTQIDNPIACGNATWEILCTATNSVLVARGGHNVTCV